MRVEGSTPKPTWLYRKSGKATFLIVKEGTSLILTEKFELKFAIS